MKFTNWLIQLKHAMIAAGYFKGNRVVRLDRNAFKPLYDSGFTPIEAVLIDMEEGGET